MVTDKNKTIYNLFEEYKNFINEQTLPQINILHINNTNKFAYFNTNELLCGQYTLYIDDKLFKYNEDFIKSILFHEFTHLYDYTKFEKSFEYNDLINIMNTVSEYNASQIELLCQMCSNKNKITMRDKKYTVWYKNDKVLLNEYILYPLGALLDIIKTDIVTMNNLSELEFYQKFLDAEKYAIYYFGKLDVCERYVDGNIVNLFTKDKPFYNELNDIHMILQNTCDIKKRIDLIIRYCQNFEREFYFKFRHQL